MTARECLAWRTSRDFNCEMLNLDTVPSTLIVPADAAERMGTEVTRLSVLYLRGEHGTWRDATAGARWVRTRPRPDEKLAFSLNRSMSKWSGSVSNPIFFSDQPSRAGNFASCSGTTALIA